MPASHTVLSQTSIHSKPFSPTLSHALHHMRTASVSRCPPAEKCPPKEHVCSLKVLAVSVIFWVDTDGGAFRAGVSQGVGHKECSDSKHHLRMPALLLGGRKDQGGTSAAPLIGRCEQSMKEDQGPGVHIRSLRALNRVPRNPGGEAHLRSQGRNAFSQPAQ